MGFKVETAKLGGELILRKACAFTRGGPSKVSEEAMLRCEHSPIRLIHYWIELYGIPSFVSNHFVRHKIGVEHFVQSLRDDRGGDGSEDRNSPVNHAMLINSQALLNMGRKRLCLKSHKKTVEVMRAIKESCKDYPIYPFIIPECDYRGGICYELQGCGLNPSW